MTRIIALELNEVNFEFIQHYVADGKLPNFQRLLARYGLTETIAESSYPLLEPWIQWPTVYTGKPYSDHQIFRLGDVVKHEHRQIWEAIEDQGLTVGAISPMNAANRCRNPVFFLPDPWTETAVSAPEPVERLYALIKRLVNDNASDDRSVVQVAIEVLPAAARYASLGSLLEYLWMLVRSFSYKWARGAILDRLLADLFIKLWRQTKPDFSSLFLNAAAHIQHHHMYDSSVYTGSQSNPHWYSRAAKTGVYPLLFIYRAYDGILADILALPDVRVLVTTGLSQHANERAHYQYRMVEHRRTLTGLGLRQFEVSPRMSRDFLLSFDDAEAAAAAQSVLREFRCGEKPLFIVEDRGQSLFCQIGYFGPPEGLAAVTAAGTRIDLREDLVLVSIENGLHRTTGYHVDTGLSPGEAAAASPMPL